MCRRSDLYLGKNCRKFWTGDWTDIFKYDNPNSCPAYVFSRKFRKWQHGNAFFYWVGIVCQICICFKHIWTSCILSSYIYFQIDSVSVENQLFMSLVKLRRYTTNFELSRFFSLSEASVKNIVYMWILFMSRQWREANSWPLGNLVR